MLIQNFHYNSINNNIIICDPLNYIDCINIIKNAKFVITDSGGIQEETTYLKVPCFTYRNNTERPSTLIHNGGTNILISNLNEIKKHYSDNYNLYEKSYVPLWDGKASLRIKKILDRIVKTI